MTKPHLDFVLTIDTEEEWDWSGPFPGTDAHVANAQELPAFQALCHDLSIKSTYLVDYAMANDTGAATILRQLAEVYGCEIGAHLHPWVNPPFYDEIGEYESHVINLPESQIEAKLTNLIDKIQQNIGCQPKSFRTGRWGIDGTVLALLKKHGFAYDSSIYPLYHNEYFDCVSAPGQPYWPDNSNTNEIMSRSLSDGIFELPVSVGYNRRPFQTCNFWHQQFTHRPFSWLRFNGILWHSGLMKKLYLSPELCTSDDMIDLTRVLVKNGHQLLHMYLHSSSLLDNATEMADRYNARENISRRMTTYINWLKSHYNVAFMTLAEAGDKYSQKGMTHD